MRTYFIKTFGCQMNHSDSERVSKILEESNFVPAKDEDSHIDLIIFNTCSVRQKAENRAIGIMGEMLKKFPNAKIGVTGCMVRQTGGKKENTDPLMKHDFIDFVFRIEDCVKLPKILENIFAGFEAQNCSYENDNYFNIEPNVANKFQVFVPIMQGCDKFCSYCIVPHTRGREISRPMKDVFRECKKLVENGAKEITLLGQNVNSYKNEGKKCFAELLLEIDKLNELGLSRIRFTAAHPQDFTDDVIDALADMKTSCPYVHLPSQHGSNSLLQDMERDYTTAHYEEIIRKIREKIPGVTFSTDIIVGFPGETEEQFQELLDFGRRVKFDFSFTAIYSPRKNTAAGEMTDKFISAKVKKERFHRFDEVVKESSWARREKSVGETLEILVEKSEFQEDGLYRNSGRSREFFEVFFSSGRNLVGQEVPVKITGRQNYVFDGELV